MNLANVNSDQLRAQLRENNYAMNTLAAVNEKIVQMLAQRGLRAIEPRPEPNERREN